MRSRHAAFGLAARIIACVMQHAMLEEEKGTWRRAQKGRRLGDADERSGKQLVQ